MTSSTAGPLERTYSIASRLFVWGLFFLLIYILRSFFTLIFLTFIFAYIQANGVQRLKPYLRRRAPRVVAVALLFVGIWVSIGVFLVPRVQDQANLFANKYPQYLQTFDSTLVNLSEEYSAIAQLFPQLVATQQNLQPDASASATGNPSASPSGKLLQELLGFTSTKARNDTGLSGAVEAIKNIGNLLISTVSSFLLALLFSFLIVLDLPKLSRGVQDLRNTRLQFIYEEVAGTITRFATVMGRAFEAQIVIALLNTLLTAIGIYILGIGENVAFLSVIVFLCSFIPVAGVFISSVPICLLALQGSGLQGLFLSIGLITVIHMIEAYILNPRIYGHHLRINPVLVLIILTIGGKLFHVWGLILGVPVCTYVFGHAIRMSERVKG